MMQIHEDPSRAEMLIHALPQTMPQSLCFVFARFELKALILKIREREGRRKRYRDEWGLFIWDLKMKYQLHNGADKEGYDVRRIMMKRFPIG
jgi:hypothetical protein